MKTVCFGNYWQANSNEKDPIEWIVLQEDAKKMYVISKYSLDCVFKGGFSDLQKMGWNNSLIRKWLNEVFLNEAFSATEQDAILLSSVKTSSTISWNGKLDSGTGVQDKLFLPSRAEAILYFESVDQHDTAAQQKRIASPTHFAYERGCWLWPLTYDEARNTWAMEKNTTGHLVLRNDNYETDTTETRWTSKWMLRSAKNSNHVVCEDGSVGSAFSVEYDFIGIRPAMWIKK